MNTKKATKGRLGTRQKGQDTRNKVINVAREILVTEGYEGFAFRKIAAQAGITAGNLQYYFKSKRELVSAVLLEEMHRYEESYKEITEASASPKTATKQLIDFLIQDISHGPTSNIWHVVWALSDHDSDLAEFVDSWYQRYLENLSAMFKQLAPALSKAKANQAAVMLTPLIDGLTFQISTSHTPSPIQGNIKRSVTQVLNFLLQE